MLTDLQFRSNRLIAAALVLGLYASGVCAQPSEVPSWVPIYPGAKITDVQFKPGRVQSHLAFRISTRDACRRVSQFYEDRLTTAGFSLVKGSSDQGCIGVMQSHDGSHTRNLNLSGGMTVRGTEFQVEVTELADSADAGRTAVPKGTIPSWVPLYPQATSPKNLASHRSARETFTTFTIETRTDVRTLLGWYQNRLRQAGFEASMDVAGNNGVLRSHTRDNDRDLKIEVSMTGGQNVAMFEVRDAPQGGGDRGNH
jgi:hypothetical protein